MPGGVSRFFVSGLLPSLLPAFDEPQRLDGAANRADQEQQNQERDFHGWLDDNRTDGPVGACQFRLGRDKLERKLP